MASLNKVLLIGNLTRDPELRYIPSGTAVASFTVAVNRRFKAPTGENREETSFIKVVVWGRMAETSAEYLKKGSSCFVEGRLQTRSWDAPDGQKRSATEVIASAVQFLNTRGGGGRVPAAESAGEGGSRHEALEEISLDAPAEAPPAEGEDVVPF